MLREFEELYGKPAGKTLSRMIRPTIAAPKGKVLVWGDWSNVEARGLPWLADAEERLDIFREIDRDPEHTPDIYLQAAAGMYGEDPYVLLERRKAGDKGAGGLRQKGKIAELALGFGGAAGALQSMAANYGMAFEAAEAKDIVERWRKANQWAVEFWDALWAAFLDAVANPDGSLHRAGKITYQGIDMNGQIWVAAYLPDGRPLIYRDVRERKSVTYDPFDKDVIVSVERKLSFDGEEGTKWLWRGLLAENATQAACASILRAALTHLESSPDLDFMPVIGHTHDEIITITTDAPDFISAAKTRLREVMLRDLGWNAGFPIEADITHHTWYSKALDD